MLYILIALTIFTAFVTYKWIIWRNLAHSALDVITTNEEEMEEVYKRVWELIDENRAIIEGRDEQEENYEQQFLTFKEQLEERRLEILRREDDITELEARLEMHDRECLPILHETRWQALSGSVENA